MEILTVFVAPDKRKNSTVKHVMLAVHVKMAT